MPSRSSARDRIELPYALMPSLFRIQRLIEGGLWLTFPDRQPHLNAGLTHLYSLFSHVLWPIWVPVAVLLLKPVRWRRRVLAVLTAGGASAGLYLLYFLVTEPIVARARGGHIAYDPPHSYGHRAGAVRARNLRELARLQPSHRQMVGRRHRPLPGCGVRLLRRLVHLRLVLLRRRDQRRRCFSIFFPAEPVAPPSRRQR